MGITIFKKFIWVGISSDLPNEKFEYSYPLIEYDVVCVTSKGSDQPAHMRSLIRAFASGLNIMTFKLKEAAEARLKMPHCWKSHVAAQLCL